ncbi:hypothetical protein V1264_024980 [Littorina saxatilis]|uniref:Sulfotransferase domain-containing protein n=2 Tax=Littorina saxatilis TaxID=31220 RepID=A0AAN9AMV6_9CAEN
MLRKGSAEHDANTKVQLMMEFVQNHILDDMPSPRTFNTHLPLSMLPVDKIKARRLKLVHVYRNPKDTCVSMYHMARSSPQMSSVVPCETFGDFAEHYLFTDKQIFGSYVKYLKQMHAFQEQNPEVPTFNMSYEDVKKDPVGSVKKLASFLSLSVSDEVCVQIADECSFDKMKAKEAEKEKPKLHSKTLDKESLERMEKNKPVIFRKGQIGDWKNYFTVAMSERVDCFLEEQLKDLPFTLTFE